jgi:hypothetical protein
MACAAFATVINSKLKPYNSFSGNCVGKNQSKGLVKSLYNRDFFLLAEIWTSNPSAHRNNFCLWERGSVQAPEYSNMTHLCAVTHLYAMTHQHAMTHQVSRQANRHW